MSKMYSDKQVKQLIEALEKVSDAREILIDMSYGIEQIDKLVGLLEDVASSLHEAIPMKKFTDMSDSQAEEALSYYHNSCTEYDEALHVRKLQKKFELGALTDSDKETIEWAFKELLIEKTIYPERFKK